MCKPKVDVKSLLPAVIPYSFRQRALKPRAHHMAHLASQLVLGMPQSQELQVGHHIHPSSYVGSKDPNFGPHTEAASTLTTESSPQPVFPGLFEMGVSLYSSS